MEKKQCEHIWFDDVLRYETYCEECGITYNDFICEEGRKKSEKYLSQKPKGIDWTKDNFYDAIGRPDLKPLDTQQNINQPIGSTTDFVINLDLKRKITQKHAQEINEIIQEKLRFQYDKGYDAGVKHYQQHIDEGIKKIEKEQAIDKSLYADGQKRIDVILENADKMICRRILDIIRKINETLL